MPKEKPHSVKPAVTCGDGSNIFIDNKKDPRLYALGWDRPEER